MGSLSGVGIIFGNITHNNLVDLTEVATALGAAVLHPSDASRASYLVASNVLCLPDGSDPYLNSFHANPALVAVSTEWLSKCQAEQRQVPSTPYLLGPFSGIKVCITNFGAKDRDGVVLKLRQGGANHSPELYRHNTHLVGNRPGGSKYTHAKEWGIFIVHHEWVLDCLKAGRRLDERLYSLENYAQQDVTTAAAFTASGDLQRYPSRSVSSARGGVPFAGECAGLYGAATASIRGIVAPGAGIGGGGLTRGGSSAMLQSNGFAPFGAEDSVAAAAMRFAKGPPGAPAFQPPVGHGQQADQFFIIPAVPPDDCYFLHWVSLWMVGCTSSEQSHVLAAIRESGATREPMLSAVVTHIVFGSILSTADLAEVRQHLSEHREQVKLARLSWLYECVNRRAYIEPEGPYAMTVAQLLLAQGGAGTGSLLPAQSGRGLGHRSREGSSSLLASSAANAVGGASNAVGGGRLVAPMDDYVPLDPEGLNRTMDSLTLRNPAGPGVFSGLWFSLVAVTGTEEEQAATKLVRQGGGMIMSASTEKTVHDPQRRYAVCPFSLPQAAVDRICNTRARDRGLSEFERVPVEQRITVAWLRACVTRGELLPVKRETPLFRPLSHALPLPRFQGLVVAVSQYHAEQREVLQELICRLGGTYTEKLNKRCHYLVIQEARGDKFTHAIKWGIPCVRADWVLESAYAGRPLEDQLPAFLPAGITLAEMEERRAAACRGGGGGYGPSQLGPTQRPGPLPISQIPATMPLRDPQRSSQWNIDARPVAGAPGLPPRPMHASHALDRHGASTQGFGFVTQPPLPLQSRGPPQPMAPPPAPSAAITARSKATEVPTAATAKPPSVLQPLIDAILDDDTDAGAVEAPPARGPGRVEEQLSGTSARSGAAAQAGNAPYSSGSAQVPPAGCSAAEQASNLVDADAGVNNTGGAGMSLGTAGPPAATGTFTSAAAIGAGAGPAAAQHDLLAHLAPPVEPHHQRAEGAAPELEGATAMLMQFLDNNKLVPDIACSQLDLLMPMPMPLQVSGGPLGSEGPLTGPVASSLSSRELGSSALSLKPMDGDGGGGVGAGRRSRKRTAAAVVGEVQGVAGKVGGLPGRRGRSAEEEEGFGVAMSQQVSYEAVAAAPPPRATRSAARGGRGAMGTDAKENLIKAVQGK